MFKRYQQLRKPFNRTVLRTGRRDFNRSGAAAVECALCLLILTPIIFGTLETCAGILVKQSLTVSAFEGVRAGTGRGTTNADILTRTRQVLEFRQVSLGEASTTEFANPGDEHGIFLITPNDDDVEDLDALDPITLRIVAPSAGNATPIFEYLFNRNIEASVTMVREFDKPVTNVVVN
jgi:hypothetical protein